MKKRHLFQALASLAVAGLGGFIYAHKIEPNWVDLRDLHLTLPRLGPEFNNYRIVQISDIHMDDWMNRKRLLKLVNMINNQQPDLIAITGDFLSYHPKQFIEDLTAGLSQLKAKDGVVAVMGNHDYWVNSTLIRQMLLDSDIIELSNSVYTIRRGVAMLHIAGVDDPRTNHARLDLVMQQLPDLGSAILLSHEPDFADQSVRTGRFDLQLSGHTHGGQIALPFIGPLFLPRDGRKYPSGLYKIGRMFQYTNRGLGMSPPWIRFNSRPEITVFTLLTG